MNGQQFTSSGVSFTYQPAPAVSSVWPVRGAAEGGTPVTVLGSGFSSAAEATGALLDSIYDQLLRGIAEGRGLDIEGARALVDATPMHPQAALDLGLVDQLQYRDEVLDEVGEERISLTKYVHSSRSRWRRGDKKVAVIYASGTIIMIA